MKTNKKNNYTTVQIRTGKKKKKRSNSAEKGHFKDLSVPQYVREIRDASLERGSTITVDTFSVGDTVTVSATSKGKGFQGVVKRHGFAGDLRTHGRKHTLRAPGSIGGGGRAGGRVVKGMRMAGRMGGDRITVSNLKILQIDAATNTVLISGAVPGRPGTLVEIRG
jgi:large subunit ribosomal protein L3